MINVDAVVDAGSVATQTVPSTEWVASLSRDVESDVTGDDVSKVSLSRDDINDSKMASSSGDDVTDVADVAKMASASRDDVTDLKMASSSRDTSRDSSSLPIRSASKESVFVPRQLSFVKKHQRAASDSMLDLKGVLAGKKKEEKEKEGKKEDKEKGESEGKEKEKEEFSLEGIDPKYDYYYVYMVIMGMMVNECCG